jgi:hypothetical protein
MTMQNHNPPVTTDVDMNLDLPPRSIWRKKVTWETMSRSEATRWIDSYNAWVEWWNTCERSKDLPLSPEWSEATFIWMVGRRHTMAFRPHKSERTAIIQFRRWQPFARGMSCSRNPARLDDIRWAAWEARSARA